MAYVDSEYYKEIFKGKMEISEFTFERASDAIDSMTYNRIIARGFEKLTPFQIDKVKKAVCLHAEFIEQYGDYIDTPLSGFSAGSVSISLDAQKANGIATTRQVIQYLDQSGLTCRRL